MQNLDNTQLWTALITPFLNSGEIDFDSFQKLLKIQEQAGNAILILGSTGEALSLTLEERKKVVEFSVSQKLSSPIMVGVGGIGIDEQLDWIEYLNEINIQSYLLVTPLYAKPGRHGQTDWFRTLLDRSQKPCMLYNVPSRTGIKMNFDSIKELNGHKNFWAIKEASGSVDDFTKYAQAAPQAKVFSGDDALLVNFCQTGHCRGLVSVASNVWPKATARYTELACKQEFETLNSWQKWSESLFVASNPIPCKWLAAKNLNIENAIVRLPLSVEDMNSEELLENNNNEVNNWLKQNL
jgi:4-hydroxy-tetrahydrodipicolinate synthase